MDTVHFTLQEARQFMLSYHGLGPEPLYEGKKGAYAYIRRVGCIQYDPLNIVGRNSELVLQSRVPDFRPSMLYSLLYEDRLLVDGMDKVMSIYPAEDWPYFRRTRQGALRYYGANEAVAEAAEEVRRAIESRGPLFSDDLSLGGKIDWAWAPTRVSRAAMESMYHWGELIVHHKKNNQKAYDFAARHLPGELLNAEEPNPQETLYAEWRVLRRIGGVGLLWDKAGDAWIGMRSIRAADRKAAIGRLLAKGSIVHVQVEGVSVPLYARTEFVESWANDAERGTRTSPRAFILAPLDNLLWDRRLIKELFDFEYVWEVYKPADQRRYGYYVLPVLYGDRFVARFDPGRDKATGALVIKNWWWEDGVNLTEDMAAEIARCFRRFMAYLGTDQVQTDADVEARIGFPLA